MKKLITVLLLFCSLLSYSQNFSYKYGKVTEDELNLKTYTADTSAVACFIYRNCDARYVYKNNRFVIEYHHEAKLKILKQEGISYGNIMLKYYTGEEISNIVANSYNMETGKVVKTKLDKKYINTEKVDDKWSVVKFSMPQVHEGTVIEYKYTMISVDYKPET